MGEIRTITTERGNEYHAFHNNSGLRYYSAWNELIDNSIDKGATVIKFECDANSVTIIDNGVGIQDNDNAIKNVLNMYKSTSNGDQSKMGHYGIGLKEATMRLGKGIIIRSKYKGCNAIQIDVPWHKQIDNNIQYNVLDEDIDEGTSIQVFGEDNETIKSPNATSFKYYDKLITSSKLKIFDCDGLEYKPKMDVLFEYKPQIVKNLSIDGKKFNLKIGILKKSIDRARSGFYVYSEEQLRYYNYAQTSIGNEVDAKDGLYVSIGLIGTKKDWIVDKNKRGILNIELIAEYLDNNNYLNRWKQKMYNEKKNKCLVNLENILSKHYGFEYGQEVRTKPNDEDKQTGTVEPKGTGRPRKEADDVRPHPTKQVEKRIKGKLKGVKVVEAHFQTPEKYLSISYESKVLVIRLNKDNKFIFSLLTKPSEIKEQMLKHLVHIALSANEIPKEEIPFKNVLDIIMIQHDNIS